MQNDRSVRRDPTSRPLVRSRPLISHPASHPSRAETCTRDGHLLLNFSAPEIQRLETMALLSRKLIRHSEAMALLKLSKSQTCRLLSRFRSDGAVAVRSGKRGLRNRASPLPLKIHVFGLITQQYRDYGPTLLSEVLAEGHGIQLSRETIRKWMIAGGIWTTNRAERKRLHQPRKRLSSYGALVQVDRSDHEWLEQRGPRCTLMVYIDDATGALQELMFC